MTRVAVPREFGRQVCFRLSSSLATALQDGPLSVDRGGSAGYVVSTAHSDADGGAEVDDSVHLRSFEDDVWLVFDRDLVRECGLLGAVVRLEVVAGGVAVVPLERPYRFDTAADSAQSSAATRSSSA